MKEKLYRKLPNGRYEEYKAPEPPYRNALYIKEGNRYIPWYMNLRTSDSLSEGVWVVTKNNYGMSMSNGKYLYDSFLCMKASDILEAPTLAELGGWNKMADYLSKNWDKVDKSCIDAICKSVVGILMNYKKEKGKK